MSGNVTPERETVPSIGKETQASERARAGTIVTFHITNVSIVRRRLVILWVYSGVQVSNVSLGLRRRRGKAGPEVVISARR